MLNTYAVGGMMIKQAFSFLPLFCILYLVLVVDNIVKSKVLLRKNYVSNILTICFLLITLCNVYSMFLCNKELKLWKHSENERLEYINDLQKNENLTPVFLKQVYKPAYRSLPDDMIRLVMPKYSQKRLLFVTDVYTSPEAWINRAFKDYHRLNYDVYSDWAY